VLLWRLGRRGGEDGGDDKDHLDDDEYRDHRHDRLQVVAEDGGGPGHAGRLEDLREHTGGLCTPANRPECNHVPENNTPAADKGPPLPLLPPARAKAPAPVPSDERQPPFELRPQPSAPSAPAREVEVEVLVKLENFRVPDGRPFLAVEELIELAVAGRIVRIAVGRRGPWQARESLELPEGEHRYTLRSTARAKGWGSYGYFGVSLTGGGTGKLRVKEGARLLLKREGCQGRYYPLWLERAG
jgi:hypothetical protein